MVSVFSQRISNWNLFSKIGKYYSKVKDFVSKYNEALSGSSQILDEVEKYKTEVAMMEDQIDEAEKEIAQLELEIQEAKVVDIHSETIKDFISQRSEHKDYKDRLGVVSIIRKDFETLSGLFYDQKDAVSTSDSTHGNDTINRHFKEGRKLERIILYIDDLDRCSDVKVLEVIQAVHLLLAFPLFNVVVGVDKRCVRNALYLKTNLEYRKIASFDEIRDIGVEMVTPDEYLEKIFQIPFELKVPEKRSMERLVDSMLNVVQEAEDEVEDVDSESPGQKDPVEDTGIRFQRTDSQEDIAEGFKGVINENDTSDVLVSSAPKDLELSELEATRIKEMLSLVGNTPRTIKQYVNIYRIIRSHEVIKYDSTKKEDVFLFIMLLLALTMGRYRKHSSFFHSVIGDKNNENKKISTMLNRLGDDGKTIVSNMKELANCKVILNNKIADFDSDIMDFVARFSFAKKEEVSTETPST